MYFNAIISYAMFALIIPSIACECKVSSQSYTTSDGIVVAKVAHIITFTPQCDGKAPGGTLYADLNGQTLPTVRSEDGRQYQISWTVDITKASSGSHVIPVYDEEGFAQLRKAQRAGAEGQKPAPVRPLLTLETYYSSPYSGPLLQTELVATIAAVLIYWIAYRAKSQLTL